MSGAERVVIAVIAATAPRTATTLVGQPISLWRCVPPDAVVSLPFVAQPMRPSTRSTPTDVSAETIG